MREFSCGCEWGVIYAIYGLCKEGLSLLGMSEYLYKNKPISDGNYDCSESSCGSYKHGRVVVQSASF